MLRAIRLKTVGSESPSICESLASCQAGMCSAYEANRAAVGSARMKHAATNGACLEIYRRIKAENFRSFAADSTQIDGNADPCEIKDLPHLFKPNERLAGMAALMEILLTVQTASVPSVWVEGFFDGRSAVDRMGAELIEKAVVRLGAQFANAKETGDSALVAVQEGNMQKRDQLVGAIRQIAILAQENDGGLQDRELLMAYAVYLASEAAKIPGFISCGAA